MKVRLSRCKPRRGTRGINSRCQDASGRTSDSILHPSQPKKAMGGVSDSTGFERAEFAGRAPPKCVATIPEPHGSPTSPYSPVDKERRGSGSTDEDSFEERFFGFLWKRGYVKGSAGFWGGGSRERQFCLEGVSVLLTNFMEMSE